LIENVAEENQKKKIQEKLRAQQLANMKSVQMTAKTAGEFYTEEEMKKSF